jgi:aspartate aminotransferase-like enzyme
MSLEEIGSALGIPFVPDEEKKENNITKIETPKNDKAEGDFLEVRKNLKHLISTGEEAIEGILKVAQEGDSPRAYEVAATLIKTVSEINKDIIDIHQRMKSMEQTKVVQNNTTNNSIFVGSTSDLQDLINKARSRKKALTEVKIEEENGE